MTVRIGWDEYEVALLIDACNRIRDNKIDKAECVHKLSNLLWRYVGVVQKGNQWNQNQGFYIYKRYCLREQMRKICFPQRS